MRNTLFIVSIILIILSSCNLKTHTEGDKKETDLSKYNKAYENASKSKVVIDTIFLGLKFGMTEVEVNNYLSKMMDIGKISIDNIGRYEYILVGKDRSVKSTLSTDYFNGKLYKFSLNFQEYGINGVYIPMDEKIMVDHAKSLFLAKIHINKDKFDSYYYTLDGIGLFSYFIKNNLVVEFNPLGSMSYINAPSEREKEIYELNVKKEKSRNTISDL